MARLAILVFVVCLIVDLSFSKKMKVKSKAEGEFYIFAFFDIVYVRIYTQCQSFQHDICSLFDIGCKKNGMFNMNFIVMVHMTCLPDQNLIYIIIN